MNRYQNTNMKTIPAIIAFIVGAILALGGGYFTLAGLIFIAISLGIDGSFIRAWKELR